MSAQRQVSVSVEKETERHRLRSHRKILPLNAYGTDKQNRRCIDRGTSSIEDRSEVTLPRVKDSPWVSSEPFLEDGRGALLHDTSHYPLDRSSSCGAQGLLNCNFSSFLKAYPSFTKMTLRILEDSSCTSRCPFPSRFHNEQLKSPIWQGCRLKMAFIYGVQETLFQMCSIK